MEDHLKSSVSVTVSAGMMFIDRIHSSLWALHDRRLDRVTRPCRGASLAACTTACEAADDDVEDRHDTALT